MSGAGIRRTGLEGHPNVVLLTIDRPPVNALVTGSYVELERAFADLEADPSVHVIVLTAAGERAFCAGADLRDFDVKSSGVVDSRTFQRVRTRAFTTMRECSVPIVGAINGPALGAGLVLASLCDLLIASTRATFGLPEVDIGLLGGGVHLARLVPGQYVRRMALTGERLSAQRVMELGGVSEVVAPEALLDVALAVADAIAAKRSVVVRMTKSALTAAEHLDLHHGHHVEQVHMLALSVQEETNANA